MCAFSVNVTAHAASSGSSAAARIIAFRFMAVILFFEGID
jgi:hypothetical protein